MDHAMKIAPLLIAAGVLAAAPAFAQASTDPARDPAKKETWLAHCYGMIGVARGNEADSGNGAHERGAIPVTT